MSMLNGINDDSPVNHTELARVMRVSRGTVYNWEKQGYQMEFGSRTTPGHCKEWLRTNARRDPASARWATDRLVLETITDPKVLERINAIATGRSAEVAA
jgi:hypothetical protein